MRKIVAVCVGLLLAAPFAQDAEAKKKGPKGPEAFCPFRPAAEWMPIQKITEKAKALGADAISSSTQVTVSKRVAPFAEKHKMMFGYHGHDSTWDPNEFSTPESFATAMSYSKYNGVNLDIGHFIGANYDPVAYIKEHHGRITNRHLKDKKKDHGPNFPWGEGDTPIKDVLLLLKKEKYKFPGNIEMEYQVPEGSTLIAEMSKCLKFCKDVLS